MVVGGFALAAGSRRIKLGRLETCFEIHAGFSKRRMILSQLQAIKGEQEEEDKAGLTTTSRPHYAPPPARLVFHKEEL